MTRTTLSSGCAIALAATALMGCGDDDTTPADAGGTVDAGATDAAPAEDAGPPYEPVWDCLGSVTIGAPPATTAARTFTINDFVAGMPAEGVLVEICDMTDVDCAAPVATVTTDAMGMGMVTVPTDPNPFWGYARYGKDGFRTHYLFSSIPIVEDGSASTNIISDAGINVIALAIGSMQDWTTNGAIGVAALDCDNRLSSGMQLTLTSGSGETFYSRVGSLFSTTATGTDPSGAWGVANAVPGDFTITAVRESDNMPIAEIVVPVRAGEIVGVAMAPTPGGVAYTP